MIAHICRKLIGICVLFTLNIKFILFFCSIRNRILRIVFPRIVDTHSAIIEIEIENAHRMCLNLELDSVQCP